MLRKNTQKKMQFLTHEKGTHEIYKQHFTNTIISKNRQEKKSKYKPLKDKFYAKLGKHI